jgi:hypothetical protein
MSASQTRGSAGQDSSRHDLGADDSDTPGLVAATIAEVRANWSAAFGRPEAGGNSQTKAPAFEALSGDRMLDALERHVLELKAKLEAARRASDPEADRIATRIAAMEADLVRLKQAFGAGRMGGRRAGS